MNPVSDNLVHFLGRGQKDSPEGQFEVFKSIIENGLRLSRITIPMSSDGVIHGNAVCFTDIPLYLLDEHVSVYGKFGVGFKKSFVKKAGGNPVRYFVDASPHERLDDKLIEVRGMLSYDLTTLFAVFRDIDKRLKSDSLFSLFDQNGTLMMSTDKLKDLLQQYIAISSFEKETGDLGPARDNDISTDSYYREREWRIVAFVASLVNGCVIEGSDGAYYAKFGRQDVNMIIVPNVDIKKKVFSQLDVWKKSGLSHLIEYASDPPSVVVFDELKSW